MNDEDRAAPHPAPVEKETFMEPEEQGARPKWQHFALVGFVAGILTVVLIYFALR